MRILHRDQLRMRLRCESDDDLWTLAQFIQAGHRFGMVGERRDSTTGGVEGGRAKAAERRTMWILLEVLSVEHHVFSDALRVHGTIVEAPFDQGLHHTHVVETGDEVEVQAHAPFRPIDVQLMEEAANAALRPKVALIVVEHDEVILFTVAQRGLKEGMTWTMRGGGKRSDARTSNSVKEAFLNKTANEIAASIVGEVPVVLAGPGHARERLAAALRGCAPHLVLTSVATSIGGRSAANEVIREGLAGEVLADHAVSRETALVEEAMTRIHTSGAVAYGIEHIERTVNEGAVETLVVLADVLRGDDEAQWQQICEAVLDLGGAVVQCSIDHDAGAQLDGLGGAIALTRYRVD
ncbi:MAG: hypothetical protein CMA08_02185 [Euryarchaeota archaeon]|nr:hypothetical protein [Euryarchaeota archaeon]OUX22657.1 MAG: hypothetical protein CBE12_01620 [Euryarchaeota archaeon TMED252]